MSPLPEYCLSDEATVKLSKWLSDVGSAFFLPLSAPSLGTGRPPYLGSYTIVYKGRTSHLYGLDCL